MSSIDPKILIEMEYQRARWSRDRDPTPHDFLNAVHNNAMLHTCYSLWINGGMTLERCLMQMVLQLHKANCSLASMYLSKVERETPAIVVVENVTKYKICDLLNQLREAGATGLPLPKYEIGDEINCGAGKRRVRDLHYLPDYECWGYGFEGLGGYVAETELKQG